MNARDYERLSQHSEAHLNWALTTHDGPAPDPLDRRCLLGQEALRLKPSIRDTRQSELIGSLSRLGFREAGDVEGLPRQCE
jgi:hypothetical protein